MKIQSTLSQLEHLVSKIEDEHVDLDTAIKHYGESVKLAQKLLDTLNKTQAKINQIDDEANTILGTTHS